jgi:outer membrane protein TolC
MKKYFALSILVLLSYAKGDAQIVISTSLDEAINRAIEKSSTIKNKELEIEKINLQKKGVWNKYIPTVEANALYLYFDNKLTIDAPSITVPIVDITLLDGEKTFENYGNILYGSLMAKTVLFSGMQIPNAAKALEQKAIGSEYLKESSKDDIIKEVINTFDQLSLLNEVEKLLDDSEKRLQTETKRVSKAIEQGLAIPYDRDKIKVATLELNSKKVELEGKRQLVYSKIRYLTNYTNSEIDEVKYNLVPYILPTTKLSSENKQEIKALELFKSAYEYMLKKEKGTYLPTLGAFGGLTYASLFDANTTTPAITGVSESLSLSIDEMTISPNWMIGAAMKWEVFAGFERKHKIHEAKINIQETQNQIDDTKEKLELLLENNYVNYTVLNQKMEIVSQQEIVANNNLTLAIKQYQEGLINISERLEAENDSYKIAVNKINTLIEQRLSAIETIITTGDLTQHLSKQNL